MGNVNFTSEQLAANDLVFKDLVELIKAKDAIAMIGAGSSGGIFPAWGEFMEILKENCLAKDDKFNADPNDDLKFADSAKKCLGDAEYYALIYDTFKPKSETHYKFHEALCRIPFKAITTTNYDHVLENAFRRVTINEVTPLHFEGTTKTKIHDFLKTLNFNKSSIRYVVHLHGSYDIENSIVLGGEEYSSKYGFELREKEDKLFDILKTSDLSPQIFSKLLIEYGYEWPIRRKILWSLLATRRIVFIGFSMRDPYFIKMLDFIENDLGTYYSETHFLILRVTETDLVKSVEFAKDLKRKYGIQTFFFQEKEDEYEGLGRFILELENAVNGSSLSNDYDKEVKAETATSKGDKSLTRELFKLSKNQDNDED